MKTFYAIIFFLLITASSFAETYYTYSAVKSGSWNDMSVWSISVRTDGVRKTKVIIPNPFIISVDNAVNSFGLGDVDINIFGRLSLLPSTNISLSAASSIALFGSGSISGTNNTQKITINNVTKYDGSLDHTKTGASSVANSVTGVSPLGFTSTALLPVTYSSFTVNKEGNDVRLKWVTATEIQNDYFNVERSYNGNAWVSVATIKGTGSAAGTADYSYTDYNVTSSTVYYRLKQVDADGAFMYSTIKTIRGVNNSAAKIYGTAKTLNIELNTEAGRMVMVTLMNTNGQVLQQKQFSAGYTITMNLNYKPTGIVIVNVTDHNGLNQTAKLML